MNPTQIRALTSDVSGTVADWRSTIIREGPELGRQKDLMLVENFR